MGPLIVTRYEPQFSSFLPSLLSRPYPALGTLNSTYDAKNPVEGAGPWFWSTWND